MEFFISDLHFGHENILKLCDRPFSSVEEMDETMTERWNARVHKSDRVYVVGDIVWDKKRVGEYLTRLNGKKVLIYGNHDEKMITDPAYLSYFESVVPMLFLHRCGHPLTFCHYPMLEWKASRKDGSSKLGYLVYGHIHNRIDPSYRMLYEAENALNAGADINGFAPVDFEELCENNRVFRRKALASLGG